MSVALPFLGLFAWYVYLAGYRPLLAEQARQAAIRACTEEGKQRAARANDEVLQESMKDGKSFGTEQWARYVWDELDRGYYLCMRSRGLEP